MVLRIEPIARALDRILREAPDGERRLIVVPSPSGPRFTQREAERWSTLDRLVVICGHYEGIDDRLASLYELEEWSLGDFVVTGGEMPALAFMDATIRLVAGTIRPESVENESFTAGLLDYPSFTRPATLPRGGRPAGASLRGSRQDRPMAPGTVTPAHRRPPQRPVAGGRRLGLTLQPVERP